VWRVGEKNASVRRLRRRVVVCALECGSERALATCYRGRVGVARYM
jgi:hypothetical protein